MHRAGLVRGSPTALLVDLRVHMLLKPGKGVRLEGLGRTVVAQGYGHIFREAVLRVMIGGTVREELCVEGDPVQEGGSTGRAVLKHCDVVIAEFLQHSRESIKPCCSGGHASVIRRARHMDNSHGSSARMHWTSHQGKLQERLDV